MSQRFLAAIACACTAACASAPGDYPSLAIRDAERVSGTLQPAQPYVPAPVAPAVLADVESLVAQARSADATYREKLGSVRSTVLAARGSDVGSDRWSVASVAVTGLETERSRAMIALAELDRLYVAASTEGGAVEELAAAQGFVGDMVAQQTAGIDELLAVLR